MVWKYELTKYTRLAAEKPTLRSRDISQLVIGSVRGWALSKFYC